MSALQRVDRASRRISASADAVYRALTDREAVERWLPPTGARGEIEAFEPRAGGAFRMILIFEAPDASGTRKSSDTTDVVEGEFLDLVPDALVRQRFTFRSEDPRFAGAMTMTWTLTPVDEGVDVAVAAEDVPAGIRPEDHAAGMSSSLENLARFVET